METQISTTLFKFQKKFKSLHGCVIKKQKLWGGNLWTSGYYANTVGMHGNKEVIRKYVENQGKEKSTQKYTRDNYD